MRKDEETIMTEMDVLVTGRSIGRQRIRWRDVVTREWRGAEFGEGEARERGF